MSADQTITPIVSSIAGLSETADAWLLDVWGVMHNGVTPFESSVSACLAFRKRGGYVLLLTNAPRPADAVRLQLDRIGVPPTAYDTIVTSGDVTREVALAWKEHAIYYLGPERDRGIFQDLDISFAAVNEADAIVCTGLRDDETETPADYMAQLQDLQSRDAVMLCANPDLKVERGNRIAYCAGALAEAYESLGGKVVYSGKPHAPIYELALKRLADGLKRNIEKERVLAIGDGVLTDIRGAATAGIRSVFIASGIHVDRTKPLDAETVEQLFSTFVQGKPVAAMSALNW